MELKRLLQTVTLLVAVALVLLSAAPVPADCSDSPAQVSAPAPSTRSDSYGSFPLLFIENRGQTDPQAAFTLFGGQNSAFFTSNGVTYSVVETATDADSSAQDLRAEPEVRVESVEAPPGRRWAVKMDFIGANPGAWPAGEDLAETVVSYFRGRPEQWQTGLRTYRRLVYHDLWPGIDLIYSGPKGLLKYEFVVHPGADPGQIRLAYRGASSVELNADGRIAVSTPVGGFVDTAPIAWQDLPAGRTPVPARFEMEALTGEVETATTSAGAEGARYRFTLGSYDRTQTLVIDPAVFGFCGYVGGSLEDRAVGIAVDAAGNAYLAGNTQSSETTFPETVGPYLANGGGEDVFVAKINAADSALAYAGYIGGSGADAAGAIAIDAEGSAYVTGETRSSESTFPVVECPDLTFNGRTDGFIAKINPTGTGLVYAGYLGGSDFESGNGIAVDGAGNAYVAGWTQSENFPVVVGPRLYKGWTAGDGFVTKLSPSGTTLIYSGFTGIDGYDSFGDIAIDDAGSAYIAGVLGPGPYPNGTATKVDPTGASFVYRYVIGGEGHAYGIAVDRDGSAYVTGWIMYGSDHFPATVGPDLTHNGWSDAYVLKLNPAGSAPVYAGWIGGLNGDRGSAITVDEAGSAYVVGTTESDENSFPALDGPDLAFNGSTDGFVVKVDPTGIGLTSASFIGGAAGEDVAGVALGPQGDIYVAGYTASYEDTFPALSGPDVTYNLGDDAFVAKITALAAVEAVHAQVRPAVDGNLVEWMGLCETAVDRNTAATITGPEPNPSRTDLSATFRAAWASDRLYLAAQFRDDVLVGGNSSQLWGDDSLELGIEALGSFHQFTIGLDGRQADRGSAISSLTVATRTVPGGWTLEASVPAVALGVTALKAGRTYRFTVGLWDDDLFTYPGQTHMIWRGTSTSTYQPEFWAGLDLGSRDYDFPQTPRSPTPAPTLTSTPTATPTATPTETLQATPTVTETPSPTPTTTLTPPVELSPAPTPTATPWSVYLPLILQRE